MEVKNAVGLAKHKHLLKLLKKLKKKNDWSLNFIEPSDEEQCHISADTASYKKINSFISFRGKSRFVFGVIFGVIFGIFLSYVLIHSGVTYLYSSDKGLIPPKYDALFKGKPQHEQVMQILTHEAQGEKTKKDGPHDGKQMRFISPINDTASIELWYSLAKKSIVVNIGQKHGERIIKSQVEKAMASTAVDSTAKYLGVEDANVAGAMGDAVSRTTAMQVEQGYLSMPVIRVVIGKGRSARIYTNYLPWEGSHQKGFLIEDSDEKKITSMDYTKAGRKKRIPTLDDEADYKKLVAEFVAGFIETKSIH